jgi:hypothetical protein
MSSRAEKPCLARSVVEFEYGQRISGTAVATIWAGFVSAVSVIALVLLVAGLFGALEWQPGFVFTLVAIPGWYVVTLVLGRVLIEAILAVSSRS